MGFILIRNDNKNNTMEKVTKTMEVYVARDGKEFVNEVECALYEKEILNAIEKVRYYSCVSHPDLTEGRGYANDMFFAVLDDHYCHEARVLTYMIQACGSPISYVMGVSPMPSWSLPAPITKDEFLSKVSGKIGSYPRSVKQVFISEKSLPGFPDPIWIE